MRISISSLKIDHYSVLDIITIIYAFYSLSGDTSNRYLYLSILLLGEWCLIALLSSRTIFLKAIADKKMLCVYLYLLYGFICGIFGGSVLYSMKQFGAGLLFFSPIIILNYYIRIDFKRLLFISRIIIIFWIYFTIRSLFFYNENQGAARILAQTSNAYGEIAIGGGYPFAYGAAILSVSLISILLEHKIKASLWKVMYIITIVLSVLVVIETRSSVTLLCFVSGIVFAFLYKNKSDNLKQEKGYPKIIYTALYIIVLFLLVSQLTEIGRIVIRFSTYFDSIVGKRILSLGYALLGEGDGSYALSRITLPLKSLQTFSVHPLFGVAYLHGNGYVSPALYGVAQHCEWADALANYGIVGSLLFFYIFVCNVKECLRDLNHIGIAWIITMFLLGAFNPFRSIQPYFIVFLIVPVLNMSCIYEGSYE